MVCADGNHTRAGFTSAALANVNGLEHLPDSEPLVAEEAAGFTSALLATVDAIESLPDSEPLAYENPMGFTGAKLAQQERRSLADTAVNQLADAPALSGSSATANEGELGINACPYFLHFPFFWFTGCIIRLYFSILTPTCTFQCDLRVFDNRLRNNAMCSKGNMQ
jgi:hypothetical protein